MPIRPPSGLPSPAQWLQTSAVIARRRDGGAGVSRGPAIALLPGMPGSHDPSLGGMERAGHLLFRVRNALAPTALVAIVALTRRDDFLGPPAAVAWLAAAGALVVAAGLALRFWVMATSGVRRSGVQRRVVAPTLYTDGAYAWTRNPLYLGNMTILVGLALAFDSSWLVAVGLPIAFGAITCIVIAEERVLVRAFGRRYVDYCRAVPRFLPRRPPTQIRTMVDWRRGLRKEHGPIFAAISALTVLLLVEQLRRFGPAAAGMPALVGAWLVAALLWVRVRRLKHAGRLGDAEPTRVVAQRLRRVA
jgi:protein-S-isoprenylcysteine O-methyltransferase Ste14